MYELKIFQDLVQSIRGRGDKECLVRFDDEKTHRASYVVLYEYSPRCTLTLKGRIKKYRLLRIDVLLKRFCGKVRCAFQAFAYHLT